jgi:hypothetical protein
MIPRGAGVLLRGTRRLGRYIRRGSMRGYLIVDFGNGPREIRASALTYFSKNYDVGARWIARGGDV